MMNQDVDVSDIKATGNDTYKIATYSSNANISTDNNNGDKNTNDVMSESSAVNIQMMDQDVDVSDIKATGNDTYKIATYSSNANISTDNNNGDKNTNDVMSESSAVNIQMMDQDVDVSDIKATGNDTYKIATYSSNANISTDNNNGDKNTNDVMSESSAVNIQMMDQDVDVSDIKATGNDTYKIATYSSNANISTDNNNGDKNTNDVMSESSAVNIQMMDQDVDVSDIKATGNDTYKIATYSSNANISTDNNNGDKNTNDVMSESSAVNIQMMNQDVDVSDIKATGNDTYKIATYSSNANISTDNNNGDKNTNDVMSESSAVNIQMMDQDVDVSDIKATGNDTYKIATYSSNANISTDNNNGDKNTNDVMSESSAVNIQMMDQDVDVSDIKATGNDTYKIATYSSNANISTDNNNGDKNTNDVMSESSAVNIQMMDQDVDVSDIKATGNDTYKIATYSSNANISTDNNNGDKNTNDVMSESSAVNIQMMDQDVDVSDIKATGNDTYKIATYSSNANISTDNNNGDKNTNDVMSESSAVNIQMMDQDVDVSDIKATGNDTYKIATYSSNANISTDNNNGDKNTNDVMSESSAVNIQMMDQDVESSAVNIQMSVTSRPLVMTPIKLQRTVVMLTSVQIITMVIRTPMM